MSDLTPFTDIEEGGGGKGRRVLLFAVFGLAGVLLLGALALLGFVLLMMITGGGQPAATPTSLPTNTAIVQVVTPVSTPTPTAPPTPPGVPTPQPTQPTVVATATAPTQVTPSPTTQPGGPTATPKGGVPDTGVGDIALLIGAGLGLVVILLVLRAVQARGRPGSA